MRDDAMAAIAEWSGTHRLIFLLRPDSATARRIAAGAKHERRVRGLKGEPLEPELLHVSLFCIGQWEGGLPLPLVNHAERAASLVEARSFAVTFDRLLSFRRRDKPPLVLCGDEGLRELMAFWRLFRDVLTDVGFRMLSRSKNITPHVTLLYDWRMVDERPIAPVSWTVRDFVLVDSLVGGHRHVELGRWTLH